MALAAALLFPAAGKAEAKSDDFMISKAEANAKADDNIFQALKKGDFSRFAGTYKLAVDSNPYQPASDLVLTQNGEVSGGKTAYGRSMWNYGKVPTSVEQMTYGGRRYYRCMMKSFTQTTGDGNQITASIYFDIFPAGVKAAVVYPAPATGASRDINDSLMTERDSIVFVHKQGGGPFYEGYTAETAAVAPTPGSSDLLDQKITVSKKSYKKAYGSHPFALQAKARGGVKLSYSSNNKKVAAVSDKGIVTIKGTGKAVITVKAARTNKYKAASAKVTIIVCPKKNKLNVKNVGDRSCSLSWKKDSRADGFIIRISKNKDFKESRDYKVGKAKNTYIIKNLSGRYYMKIKAYKTINNKKYGKWSDIITVTVKK